MGSSGTAAQGSGRTDLGALDSTSPSVVAEDQMLQILPTDDKELVPMEPALQTLDQILPTVLKSMDKTRAGNDAFISLGTVRLYKAEESRLLPSNLWTMRGAHDNDMTFPHSVVSTMVARGCLKTELIESMTNPENTYLRVYALPEDAGISIHHWSESLKAEYRRFMRKMLEYIDKSRSTWDGQCDGDSHVNTYSGHAADRESLFYIFNTLESPNPAAQRINDIHAEQSITEIIHGTVQGLLTELYPYQRRSAAMMIQRETSPIMSLDPRLRKCRGPAGQEFYLDTEDGVLRRDSYLYEEPKGGILAETMGYGKTLICLAVILATRGHYPSLPDNQLESGAEPSHKTASLLEMAARQAIHYSVPWKAEFHALRKEGYELERCTRELGKHVKNYNEPILTSITPSRKGKRHFEKTVRLSSGSLVIVPQNLLVQWQSEISKHVEPGALDVLVLDHATKVIPVWQELIRYDVVLITKARFEQEYRDDDLHAGKRRRFEEAFQSSLTDVRWLRVICDEGHGFAGSSARTTARAMLDKMYVERRWVVSGTPSSSLLGVEVSLAAKETSSDVAVSTESTARALQARRNPDALDQEAKDIEKLRLLVVDFLRVKPWANSPSSDHANFKRYLSPVGANGQRRKTAGLRTLLQSLIVRHRIEDIEIDLTLPPLYNRVAFLEPSFYDKLSINLFVSVLASNAVTSERVDEDYMFHAKNRKQLDILINNLRQASFHWVGFKPQDILESIRISRMYLDKDSDQVSFDDRAQLLQAISIGGTALEDSGWRAFSTLHEIGVYVEGFPEYASEAWALDGRPATTLLLGTVQARNAQQHVEAHLEAEDPAEGLAGAGLRAMQAAYKRADEENETVAKNRGATNTIEEPKLKDQTSSAKVRSESLAEISSKKRIRSSSTASLLPTSPLSQTHVVGFSSAKLTYLMDQVLQLQSSEKIVIMYENNNCAFWVAEALELLSIKFLIYSNTLTVARRATYLATFNQKEEFRVLLMDLKQAAHGLHIASASRVFILSPIWQPNIEAQAIKRAHRIGQMKPVYVETLVLKDTLEDRMLKRRKQMSNLELQRAEKSLLDDSTMAEIIKHEAFIPFRREEMDVTGRVARLKVPQPLFGRTQGQDNPEEGLVMTAGDVSLAGNGKRKKRKKVVMLDATMSDASTAFSTPEPSATTALNPSGTRVARFVNSSEAMSDVGAMPTEHVVVPSTKSSMSPAPLTASSRMNVSFLLTQ